MSTYPLRVAGRQLAVGGAILWRDDRRAVDLTRGRDQNGPLVRALERVADVGDPEGPRRWSGLFSDLFSNAYSY